MVPYTEQITERMVGPCGENIVRTHIKVVGHGKIGESIIVEMIKSATIFEGYRRTNIERIENLYSDEWRATILDVEFLPQEDSRDYELL